MTAATFLGFALAALVISVVPGPDMMFILGQSLAGGRRAGLVSALGVSLGLSVHTVAAALGLSAVLAAAPFALDVVRWCGAAVLLYLAFAALRSAPGTDVIDTRPAARRSLGRTFLWAALTNLANPKVILFYLAFVPQFIDPRGSWPVTIQFLVLGLTLMVIGLVVDAATGLASGALAEQLRRRPAVRRWLDRGLGALFAGLAVRLVIDSQN